MYGSPLNFASSCHPSILLGCVVEYDCTVSIDDHGVIKLAQFYDGHGMGKGILESKAPLDSPVSSRTNVVNPVTWAVRCQIVGQECASALELVAGDAVVPVMWIGAHHFK